MNDEEISRVFARIDILREQGKLPTLTQEDTDTEPTALAYTPNDNINGDEELSN